MTEFLVGSFAMFFVVVDPIALVPLFMALTEGDSDERRAKMAVRAVLFSTTILVAFLFGGAFLLGLLGITMPAFQIAGGSLLFLLSVEMVFAGRSGLRATPPSEHSEGLAKDDISVFPLAFPLIAGPGAITTVLLFVMKSQGRLEWRLAALGVVVAVMLVSLALLLGARRLMSLFGKTGANVMTRLLGLILAALATQYIIDGVSAVVSHSAVGISSLR
jgi:multiple antibiotic resistance protein